MDATVRLSVARRFTFTHAAHWPARVSKAEKEESTETDPHPPSFGNPQRFALDRRVRAWAARPSPTRHLILGGARAERPEAEERKAR